MLETLGFQTWNYFSDITQYNSDNIQWEICSASMWDRDSAVRKFSYMHMFKAHNLSNVLYTCKNIISN